ADFRRSIVTSEETLTTIVDASIRELQRMRGETGNTRLKIIASALNYQHCHQIVQFYQERGMRADFVHSRRDSPANEGVLERLNNHELDVIVQVRKLGEGFDHPYLSVAAVCSVFRELSPFVQFVGRIMRVIDRDNRNSPLNQGTVVFHAGANIARRWADFREFSAADQEYFDQLLPMEGLDFTESNELLLEPTAQTTRQIQVQDQEDVTVQEIPLIQNQDAMRAVRLLQESGYTIEEIQDIFEHRPLPTTRVRRRQAARRMLENRVRLMAGTILNQRSLSHEGRELNGRGRGRSNFVAVKSRIDILLRERVADKRRHEYTQDELDQAFSELESIREQVERDYFNA
ncbi:MAG: DEAD/DEAH box helicase, partial [Proteobacteria bacterium]|nr:DEAD/DEAH box helicase [Pseudomonadota bacterium]